MSRRRTMPPPLTVRVSVVKLPGTPSPVNAALATRPPTASYASTTFPGKSGSAIVTVASLTGTVNPISMGTDCGQQPVLVNPPPNGLYGVMLTSDSGSSQRLPGLPKLHVLPAGRNMVDTPPENWP